MWLFYQWNDLVSSGAIWSNYQPYPLVFGLWEIQLFSLDQHRQTRFLPSHAKLLPGTNLLLLLFLYPSHSRVSLKLEGKFLPPPWTKVLQYRSRTIGLSLFSLWYNKGNTLEYLMEFNEFSKIKPVLFFSKCSLSKMLLYVYTLHCLSATIADEIPSWWTFSLTEQISGVTFVSTQKMKKLIMKQRKREQNSTKVT